MRYFPEPYSQGPGKLPGCECPMCSPHLYAETAQPYGQIGYSPPVLVPNPMPGAPAPLPETTDEDTASLAYFLSDPTCKSFRLTL